MAVPTEVMGLAVALVVLAGCRTGEDGTAVRVDSAGVELVTNSAWPPEVALSADTSVLIGGRESGAGSFFRVGRPLVDVDESGMIFVLDPTRPRVEAFTAAGDLVASWGRRGEGPGELESPLAVAASGGRVTVHEASRAVFISYDRSGGLLGEQPAPRTVINMGFRHVEAMGGTLFFWHRDPYAGTDDRFDRLLSVNGADTTTLLRGRPSHRSTAHHPRCSVTFTIGLPLSPRIHWTQHGSLTAVAGVSDVRFDLFEGTRLVRRVSIGEPAGELSRDQAIALLEAREVRGPCDSSPSELVDKHGFHATPQLLQEITVAPDGWIWVRTQTRTSGSRIVVFDASGAGAAVLPTAFPMPIAFLPDGRGLIRVIDPLDVERIGILDFGSIDSATRSTRFES